MKPHPRLRTLPLLLAVLPWVAPAQETTLSPVVVSAPKEGAQPSANETVNAQAAHPLRAATSDAAGLLRDVPGMSLQGAGGIASLPVLQGLADDRLRIKIDGMDLISACPNHMNPPLSYLDPSQVGTIKVYAGLAPVSVGGDSIGGAIIAETAEPAFAPSGQAPLVAGEVGAFFRTNGNARGANLSATYATESFSFSYTGATAQSGNYAAGGKFKNFTDTGRVGHTLARNAVGSTAYETRNHTLGVALRGGDHLLEARLGFQDMPYQLWPNQRMDLLENTQQRLNLRYLGRFDWGTLEARAYRENVDHAMDFGVDKRFWYGANAGAGVPCSPIRFAGDPAGTCAAGMPMHTVGRNTGATLKGNIHLTGRDLLRLGGELQRYRLDDRWPASGGGMGPFQFLDIHDGERNRGALFAEWERRLDPRWMTLAGLRFERVDMDAGRVHGYNFNAFPTNPAPAGTGNQTRDAANFNNADRGRTDNNWDMTLLARYTPDATRDIEFGFAHKTRSPNLYERYAWSTWTMAALMVSWAGDGNGYVGNVALKPEKADTLSATFDWHAADRGWEFKATPYYTRVNDYIDAIQWNGATDTPRPVPQTNQFTVLKFMNQSARLYGLDLSGKLALAKTGLGEFGLKGMLGYTHGRNRDTGDGLYNIMPLNAKLTLTHRLGGWDNALELVMVKGKNGGADARNEIDTPGYALVNLRAGHTWKQVRFDFGVENLFDRLYYHPLGGAYTGQGRTMSIAGTPWGLAVPGPGRSLYAGLTVKFR